MTADQLLNEIRTVAQSELNGWLDLRRDHITALNAMDSARVGEAVIKLTNLYK